jgi:hypothetical protein
VLALGVGSYFGLDAMNKKSSAGCNSDSVCPNQGAADELRSAQSSGQLATPLMIGGAALVAGGLALWFLAPRESLSVAPAQTGSGGTLLLRGVW